MKYFFLSISMLACSAFIQAQKAKSFDVASPDGNIKMHIETSGKIVWSVKDKDPTIIEPSSISLQLQNEIFGPASLIVLCKDKASLLQALNSLHGQLTATVIATAGDMESFSDCIGELSSKVGRVVYNNVPTGVEVCHAMVHGGPFQATTDARSTSVGCEAIRRFVRPLCLQDCPQEFLPDALKNNNPLHIMRKVNGVYTNDSI